MEQSVSEKVSTLCPFCDETEPTVAVNPRMGLYHCFGCGAQGDVLTLLLEMQNRQLEEQLAQSRRQAETLKAIPLPPRLPWWRRWLKRYGRGPG